MTKRIAKLEAVSNDGSTRECPTTLLNAILSCEQWASERCVPSEEVEPGPRPLELACDAPASSDETFEPKTTLYVRRDGGATLVATRRGMGEPMRSAIRSAAEPRHRDQPEPATTITFDDSPPRPASTRARRRLAAKLALVLAAITGAGTLAFAHGARDGTTPRAPATLHAGKPVLASASTPPRASVAPQTSQPSVAPPRPSVTASDSVAVDALASGRYELARDHYHALAVAHPDSRVYPLIVSVLTRRITARCRAQSAAAELPCP